MIQLLVVVPAVRLAIVGKEGTDLLSGIRPTGPFGELDHPRGKETASACSEKRITVRRGHSPHEQMIKEGAVRKYTLCAEKLS